MKLCFIAILLLIIACKSKSVKVYSKANEQHIQFNGKYIVCDTCESVIVIKHQECTLCGEISVDSGTVYISREILKSADSLVNNSKNIDSFVVSPNIVSISELYFSDTGYHKRLWKNKINSQESDKIFRLTGRVTGIKRRILNNGIVEIYPSLFFTPDKFEEINKTTKAKF